MCRLSLQMSEEMETLSEELAKLAAESAHPDQLEALQKSVVDMATKLSLDKLTPSSPTKRRRHVSGWSQSCSVHHVPSLSSETRSKRTTLDIAANTVTATALHKSHTHQPCPLLPTQLESCTTWKETRLTPLSLLWYPKGELYIQVRVCDYHVTSM